MTIILKYNVYMFKDTEKSVSKFQRPHFYDTVDQEGFSEKYGNNFMRRVLP